jgi:hypothetical protein
MLKKSLLFKMLTFLKYPSCFHILEEENINIIRQATVSIIKKNVKRLLAKYKKEQKIIREHKAKKNSILTKKISRVALNK